MLKKILLGAGVPVVALSSSALLGGVANAAQLTYADTSVAASHVSVDQVTSITATFGTPATSVGSTAVQVPTADKVQLGAADSLGTSKPLTWSIAPTTSGAVITSAGLLTLPSTPVTAPVALTVEVTDGTAKAFATVNVGVGASALTDSVSVAPDIVTVPAAADDNPTGTVDFGSAVPAGQTYTLGNAPAGVALTGSVLAATSAVPGGYTGVTVTATDGGNATAVETFAIDVKGSVVKPTPAPQPHLYGGHVVYVNNNRAEIAWNESAGVHCVLTRTFGYGFSPNGSPHIGFTCDTGHPGTDAGYWAGLAAGHGYDIQLIPAGANRMPLPGAVTGWIYIHTTQ